MKVKKMETALSTSFHVNRKQRDWMIGDVFFSSKMCDMMWEKDEVSSGVKVLNR